MNQFNSFTAVHGLSDAFDGRQTTTNVVGAQQESRRKRFPVRRCINKERGIDIRKRLRMKLAKKAAEKKLAEKLAAEKKVHESINYIDKS